ncbi:hypothetical protein FE772_06565 [Lysobacter enzymogenes]|nr:hypothetical protein [Lysobacter enzymogenes]QCW25376.1 hypothetical protein FE772_06565 [Lysobacter enzymogenes]
MRLTSKGMLRHGSGFAAVAFAAALTAGSAFAHQTNPQCYLDGVQTQPVAEFTFTSRQVAKFHADLMRRPPGSCPAGLGGSAAKSCGQVDHWHVARIMSDEYCAGLQGNARASGARPVAEVTAPLSYLKTEHHQLYTYRAADPDAVVLRGLCVICITVEAPPSK